MKELLIIRSVSLQQLDTNILALRKIFTDCSISVLTHEHGEKLTEKYKMVDRVYIYPYSGKFSFQNKAPALKGKHFDKVVVPVTNLSGAGFINVFLFALTLPAKEFYLCNLVSDVRILKRRQIIWKGLNHYIFSSLALLLTALLVLPACLYLGAALKIIQRRE